MTPERELIDTVRALLAKGTRKPWCNAGRKITVRVRNAIIPREGPPENILGTDQEGYAIVMNDDDCALIVQAPELLEALCAALEKACAR